MESTAQKLEAVQFLVSNAFTLVGGVFAAAFMILVFSVFVKALRSQDLGDLFQGEIKKEMSLTKFWSNIAYFAATIAFLALNLMPATVTGISLELLWLIYLGTIGGNAVINKLLVLKYKGKEDDKR